MKKLLSTTAAAILVSGTLAFAGGLAEPVMEPDAIEAATSSASHDFIVPLMLLLVIVAALSAGDPAPLG